ncbi:hypothetical protein A2U01_0079832, partial [Trifolium medium]|nr:hypothetical protein [Trifolium medium]
MSRDGGCVVKVNGDGGGRIREEDEEGVVAA